MDRVLALLDKPKRTVKQKQAEYTPEFEEIWQMYPKRAGNNPKNTAWRALQARLSEQTPLPAVVEGVRRYKAFCEATGRIGTEYVMQGATFFGPRREWENDWDVPHETRMPKTDKDWLEYGKEHHLEPKVGEEWHQYKARLMEHHRR